METVVCPNCSAKASSEDFICPTCGVILNEAAFEDEPVSLVEALLAPANSSASRKGEEQESIGNDRTVRATILMDEYTVPRLLLGIDLALKPLTPFEAYVASFIDGRHSVPEIAASAEISNLEAMVVLQTLAFRDVVEIKRDETRKPGEAPELDEEPKTDPDALKAEDIAAAEALSPPAFDPEALKAAMLAAAEANYPSTPPPDAFPVEDDAPLLEAEPEVPVLEAEPEVDPPVVPTLLPEAPGGVAPLPGPVAKPPAAALAGPGATANAARAATPAPRRPVLSPSPPSKPAAPMTARPSQPPGLSPAAARPSNAGLNAASPPARPLGTSSPSLTGARSLAASPPTATGSRSLGATPAPPTQSRAVPLEERPTQLGGSPSIEYTLERAISLERRGDVDGAVYILKKAIAQSSNAAPLYNKLALALVKRKEFAEAVKLLEKAVSIAPDDSSYQQNLYKVMGLAAATGKGKKEEKSGVLGGLFKRK